MTSSMEIMEIAVQKNDSKYILLTLPNVSKRLEYSDVRRIGFGWYKYM